MTSPDNHAGRIEPSDSTGGGSEPTSAGREMPPIEESPTPPDYTPPPAYNPGSPPYSAPAPGGYDNPQYNNPSYNPSYDPSTAYPPPPSGYPPPYPDAGFSGTSYPPPPYGAAPGGYPPPPAGYPGADYGYGAPVPPGTNTMAIASLVASIVGVCCGIGSIVGIVLGILALNQIKQTRQAGHGLAVAGIAVGGVSLVISLVWTIAALSN